MPSIPPKLHERVRAALSAAGHRDLALELDPYRSADEHDLMTAPEAAALLGVSSPNTVKNWLEGGHFPGAQRTLGGHWRLPRSEVLAVKERMRALHEKNVARDFRPPDSEEEPPLL